MKKHIKDFISFVKRTYSLNKLFGYSFVWLALSSSLNVPTILDYFAIYGFILLSRKSVN